MEFFSFERLRVIDDTPSLDKVRELFRQLHVDYGEHLDTMRPQLPARLRRLALLKGVHDGLLSRVDHDRQSKTLRLVLRCGSSQTGYFNLDLRYAGARISYEHDVMLASVARTTRGGGWMCCDATYHEMWYDADGSLVHRLLFRDSFEFNQDGNERLEVVIRCSDLHWRRVPRKERDLLPCADRYPNGPSEQYFSGT